MVVFVMLGLAADNIFVLWDAWRQSDSYPQLNGNLKKRMAYTIKRASKAILATSSTTAFAFFSNGFSSIMPVSAFGFFAAIIVPINFILIVFYFPAYIIIYETTYQYKEKALVDFFKNSINLMCTKKQRKSKKQ